MSPIFFDVLIDAALESILGWDCFSCKMDFSD